MPYVFSLTQKGIEHLQVIGLSAGTRKGTFSEHTLKVNDALIMLVLASKQELSIRLVGLRHERYFKQHNVQVGDKQFLEPDGFLHFQLGSKNEDVGVCLEIDLGTEIKEQWREKVRKYLHFASGIYQKQFGLESLTIAVCSLGGNMKQLITWTKEELRNKKEYAPLFLFTNRNPVDCDPVEWLTAPVWTDIDTTPYALIENHNPMILKKDEESRQQQAGILHLVKQEELIQPVPDVPQPQEQPAQPAQTSKVRQAIVALTFDRYKDERDEGLFSPSLSYGEWLNNEVNKILEGGEKKQKDT